MSFFNTDSQVEHFLRSFRDLSQGLYNLGRAALQIAEVNQKTLPMIERMDHLMEKIEPLADHAIECMKAEMTSSDEGRPRP